MKSPDPGLQWHRVLDAADVPEGRAATVTAGTMTLALTHFEGQYSAMDNACPHQGGPLGASFSNHTGITPKKFLIQVDFDPLALGKFHAVDIPVWGEISVVTRAFLERLENPQSIDHTAEIAERWQIWRTEKERRELDDRGKGVNSASVFAALNRHVPENAVIAVDVGNNAYSFGRYFEPKAGQAVLMSGYLDSIGLGQYLAELTTAVKYEMNITHVLLNNSELGKISKEQRAGHWDVWETSLHNPDFAEYANLCGALGIRVTDKSKLDDALARAAAHAGPALVEVVTDADLV